MEQSEVALKNNSCPFLIVGKIATSITKCPDFFFFCIKSLSNSTVKLETVEFVVLL